jgi:hypothetical protein
MVEIGSSSSDDDLSDDNSGDESDFQPDVPKRVRRNPPPAALDELQWIKRNKSNIWLIDSQFDINNKFQGVPRVHSMAIPRLSDGVVLGDISFDKYNDAKYELDKEHFRWLMYTARYRPKEQYILSYATWNIDERSFRHVMKLEDLMLRAIEGTNISTQSTCSDFLHFFGLDC